MSKADNFKTEQEQFWAGDFGDEYIKRNNDDRLLASSAMLFGRILKSAPGVKSLIELGCNIGLNLAALHRINSTFELTGFEINKNAAKIARDRGIATVNEGTILSDLSSNKKADLVFTRGVLIHINPSELDKVYENLFNLSNQYIAISEYYSPVPVSIPYRGVNDRLFKRDFAGELMDKYSLKLVDYGFNYQRDNHFDYDDSTYFLLEKK